jgi:peptidyl-prolyl cis-trans isomerase A (cyclophilin A)
MLARHTSLTGLANLAAVLGVAGLGVAGLGACSSSTAGDRAASADAGADSLAPEPDPAPADPDAGAAPDADAAPPFDPGPDPLQGCTRDPGAPSVTVDPKAPTDPTGGADKFTLAAALAGMPAGPGKLTAAIATDLRSARSPGVRAQRTTGTWITCELFEQSAPLSVANFVGLARGTRPYQRAAKWQVGHFYDGLTWHRVVPGFVVQGGDPDGDGSGGPGYDMVVENQVDEPRGTLAMAAGATPSGSQFYVVVGHGPAPKYNVFGACTLPTAIALSRVARDRFDAPKTAVHMLKVEIARCL